MKHIFNFNTYLNENNNHSYPYILVEDFDEEYQCYNFIANEIEYILLIEEKRYGGDISKTFFRFKPKNGFYDDIMNKGNAIKIGNTVLNIINEFSNKFNIKTLYCSPSTNKRFNIFNLFLNRVNIKSTPLSDGNIKIELL